MKLAALGVAGVTGLAVATTVLAGAGREQLSLSEKTQLFVVGRSGGLRQLTTGPRDHFGLAWSPNSRRLATPFGSGIEVLDPSGGRVKTVRISHINEDDSIAWSPSGRYIAFETTYDNRRTGAIDARLRTLDVHTTARHTVAHPASVRPSWTPGSGVLVYVRGDVVGVAPVDCTPPPDRPPDPTCRPEKAKPDEIWKVRADGRGARRLVTPASSQFSPQLSHDGRRLLYARTPASDDGAVGVWIARRNGSHRKRLAKNLTIPDVAWAPNDRDVVVIAAGRSRSWAFVVSPSGRRRKLPRAIDSNPMAWSPDGQLIAWPKYSRRGPSIETIHPDGGGRRVIARLPAGVQVDEMSWSPDGRRLAFTARKPPPED
jgi:Tol biopolymer transport system component